MQRKERHVNNHNKNCLNEPIQSPAQKVQNALGFHKSTLGRKSNKSKTHTRIFRVENLHSFKHTWQVNSNSIIEWNGVPKYYLFFSFAVEYEDFNFHF